MFETCRCGVYTLKGDEIIAMWVGRPSACLRCRHMDATSMDVLHIR